MDDTASVALARQNLAALGIPVSDEDLEKAHAAGFFSTAQAFQVMVQRGGEVDDLPDFLTDRLPAPRSWAATGQESPSAAPEILELARALRNGETSSRALVERALEQIARRDQELNAFQLLLPEQALADAEARDAELARGIDRGPLHGLPVALKDLIDLAGTPTTAGSAILANAVASRDATVVQRLRAAGAVIVGKTRLPEFAYSGASNNPHYGPVPNPRDRRRDSGGSSSGSAAAVAAGLVVMAVGSDTGGSIRIPAAYCGIVGLKPTFGRVSMRGVYPLAWSLDHIGPLTRTVTDAAVSLEAMAGPDEGDPRTRAVPLPDLVSATQVERLELRVGVVRSTGGDQPLAAPDAVAACERAVAALADAGADLIPLVLPELETLRIVSAAIAQLEAAALHAPTARERWTHYGEFFRLRLLGCFAYPCWSYVAAQRLAKKARARLMSLLGEHDIALLALPTTPTTAPPLGQWTARASWLTAPFNLLGWPALSVPAGLGDDGLPIGLQLVARPWREDLVIAAGALVERAARSSRGSN